MRLRDEASTAGKVVQRPVAKEREGSVKERVRIKKVGRYTTGIASCTSATDVNENKESPPSSDFLSTTFNQQIGWPCLKHRIQCAKRKKKKKDIKVMFHERRNAAENERNIRGVYSNARGRMITATCNYIVTAKRIIRKSETCRAANAARARRLHFGPEYELE